MKFYFNFSILLILMLPVNLAYGQNIKGLVLDLNGEPLENVNVYFIKQDKGTITNDDGVFHLLLKNVVLENDILQFSMIGYTTLKITLQKFQSNNNTVSLSEKIENLDEVALSGKNRLKEKLNYSILTRLKTNVFAFGSYVVNNKIYIVGGDASSLTDVVKKTVIKSNNMISGVEDLFTQMRRYNEHSKQGYSKELQIYDLVEKMWVENKAKLDNRAYHNLEYYNDNLYAFGGQRVSQNGRLVYLNDKIEIVNLDSLTVTVDQTNPHQAINFASVIYKDYMVVMGGSYKESHISSISYSDKVHFYNFNSGLWYELPNMLNPKEAKGVLVKDKIYLVGGYNGNSLSVIDVFDLSSGSWKKEIDLPRSMSHPALSVYKENIYIYDSGFMLVYNTTKKSFVKYEINLHVEHASMHYFNGIFYLIGGYIENDYSKKPSSTIYTIKEDEFLKTKAHSSPR